jgi:hypothetical protein
VIRNGEARPNDKGVEMANSNDPRRRPKAANSREREARWLLAIIAALAVLLAITLARRYLFMF